MNALEGRLKALLVSSFGMEEQEVDPHVSFGDLGVDSIALVELAVLSEEEFGVKIGDDAFTQDHTLITAAEFLASKGVSVQ
jgi:acyl carrier protein